MKGNKKPLYVLGIFILIFSIFAWTFMKPSSLQVAIGEVKNSPDITTVKMLWDQGKEYQSKPKFSAAVRDKILSLGLSKEEEEAVMQWLPPATNNLNIIVVPDLSMRTADGSNSHSQIEFDTALINQVWASFKDKTRTASNSKDRLIIDVADRCQASGQFRDYADKLVFDLSEHKGQSNIIFFKNKQKQFAQNVAGLYEAAAQDRPAANNYISYFERRLRYHVKESTLTDKYRNVVFILSDGYMEDKNSCSQKASSIDRLWNTDNSLQSFAANRDDSDFKYPLMREKFPDIEVYVLEVDPRNNHEDGLIHWWETWLKGMDVPLSKGGVVFPHTASKNQWKKKVDEIIKG